MSDKVAEQNLKMFQSKVEHIEHNTFEKELKAWNGPHTKMAPSRPRIQQGLSSYIVMATTLTNVNASTHQIINTKINQNTLTKLLSSKHPPFPVCLYILALKFYYQCN